jgi:hypothetical protein
MIDNMVLIKGKHGELPTRFWDCRVQVDTFLEVMN